MVASPPRSTSLRRKWTASLLALLGLFAATATFCSYRIALFGSSYNAREWLRTMCRRAPTYYEQVFLRLQGQGALLARSPRVAEAFRSGRGEGLAAELAGVARPGRGSFWLAASPAGVLLGTDAPACAQAALGLLRRSGLERGAFLMCGAAPAMAVAVPVGPDARRGWLVLGERLGEVFVDDLAHLTGAEVVLWGPTGQVAGTFRDQGDRPVAVTFDEEARGLLASLAHDSFGRHELSVPGYRGYGIWSDHPFAVGRSRIPSFVYIGDLDATAAELPVRLVLAVPDEVLAVGARYSAVLMTFASLLSLLVFGWVAVRLVAGFLRPLATLAAASDRVARGDLEVRIPEDVPDEVARLARAFNEMVAGLKQTQERLIQSARMAAVGQLAAGMAHELNNPLGVILGFAQAMERRIPESDPARFPAQSIVRETLRCRDLVQHLLTFSRAGVIPVEPVDLNALIAQTIPLLEERARGQGVGVELQLAPEAPVLDASKAQLQQVLLNLGANALDAMPRGGKLTLRTASVKPSGARIEVADTGGGIPESVRARIFDPFFTTKPVGQGTGLGLSVAYEIVARHQGDIQVESRAGQGTTMVISLPCRGPGPEPHGQRPRASGGVEP